MIKVNVTVVHPCFGTVYLENCYFSDGHVVGTVGLTRDTMNFPYGCIRSISEGVSMNDEELIKLCIDIYAHNEAGASRITIGGRDSIPEQVLGVANKILEILGVSFDDIEERVEERMQEIVVKTLEDFSFHY